MRKLSTFLFLSALLTAQIASGQAKTGITGKITDSLDQPVRGAEIFADNVSCNEWTNNKGEYEIKIDLRTREISVLTRSGYVQSAKFDGKNSIDFILPAGQGTALRTKKARTEAVPSDEMVNVGYNDVKQYKLTTPATTIDKKNDAIYQNVYEMLRATPGVQVSGKRVTIQGASSINSSSEPLFVVDGAPVNDIDNISPEMVKSINVLKGSSGSIYGVRGANGVIVINLKK